MLPPCMRGIHWKAAVETNVFHYSAAIHACSWAKNDARRVSERGPVGQDCSSSRDALGFPNSNGAILSSVGLAPLRSGFLGQAAAVQRKRHASTHEALCSPKHTVGLLFRV